MARLLQSSYGDLGLSGHIFDDEQAYWCVLGCAHKGCSLFVDQLGGRFMMSQ